MRPRRRSSKPAEPTVEPPLPSEADVHPPDKRADLGPRRAALQQRRRAGRRRRLALGAGALAAVAAAAVAGGVVLRDRAGSPQPSTSEAPPVAADPLLTTLVFGTRERADEPSAVWLSLLGYDAERGRGTIIYIPAHTAVEVPGHGLQGLGESLSDGVPLLLVATENLVGVPIDRYLELSDADARVLFEAVAPVTVDVPREVRVPAGRNQARLLFAEGQQRLPATFLVRLLYTLGIEGDDVELGTRHLAFWQGLTETYSDDPGRLAAAVRASGGALVESDADVSDHAELLRTLVSLDPPQLTMTSLPVRQVSVGGSALYSYDEAEVDALVASTLGRDPSPRDEVRVQILNGNGAPGIGEVVAERLVGQGFRVILSGNAQRLDYQRTLIITYDATAQGEALAERARRRLGVGQVQVSAQQQGIVDLTIVVGKDFLRTL